MSIGRMFQLVAQREAAGRQVKGSAASADATKIKEVTDSAMQKILSFVPAEVIGIYIAGFGIFTPKTVQGKWWIYGLCIGLIFVLMLLDYFLNLKKALPVPNWWRFLVLLILAVVGFSTWAAALPETPFLAFDPRATLVAGFVAPILALAMPRIAQLFDLIFKTS
jgi:hypothetical protein